jgi:hypothetical protein
MLSLASIVSACFAAWVLAIGQRRRHGRSRHRVGLTTGNGLLLASARQYGTKTCDRRKGLFPF